MKSLQDHPVTDKWLHHSEVKEEAWQELGPNEEERESCAGLDSAILFACRPSPEATAGVAAAFQALLLGQVTQTLALPSPSSGVVNIIAPAKLDRVTVIGIANGS